MVRGHQQQPKPPLPQLFTEAAVICQCTGLGLGHRTSRRATGQGLKYRTRAVTPATG